jgi:hypothetical protein
MRRRRQAAVDGLLIERERRQENDEQHEQHVDDGVTLMSALRDGVIGRLLRR